MHLPKLARRRRSWLVLGPVGAAAVAVALLAQPGSAQAARTPAIRPAALANAVTFIGDSVTAGFGYCGTHENASGVRCAVNQQMADSWFYATNSLKDCAPPDPPAGLTDACSNDNDNGHPWEAGPWQPGPDAPDIAYPFQVASAQATSKPAVVRDWAVTGSTPADWDPAGGEYTTVLRSIKDQYVVLTLGANPLLSYFTNVNIRFVPGFDVIGRCVRSTGYRNFFGTQVAEPIRSATDCLNREWQAADQTRHLVNVYQALLAQGDRVLVLGYYRNCPWSFGFWQRANAFTGPSDGDSCTSQSADIDGGSGRVSQWEQAVAVGNDLNRLIGAAVAQARAGATTPANLAFVTPDEDAWGGHQGWSPAPWVLLNDTWIHPNRAGAGQLARTVETGMCASFGHWCGTPPVWG